MINEKEPDISYYSTAGRSMFPFICWNEYIVVKKTNQQDINIGDVILFSMGNNNVKEAHRVVKKEYSNGRLIFQTKGDHNKELDPPIDAGKIIGKVVALKRKNRLFALPSRGIEIFWYNISCFALSTFALSKKITRKLLLWQKN